MNKKIMAVVMAALMVYPDWSMFVHAINVSDSVEDIVMIDSQWKGKKVAFLGDSITDKQHIGTERCYWEFLTEMLGIEAFSYGINGNQMDRLLKQAQRLLKEHGQDIDAIFVFAGTNDFNAGIPVGTWFENVKRDTPMPYGKKVSRTCRNMITDTKTFCGRINVLMDFLKTNFPSQQIILLTPLHRGYAQFGVDNVQPEESFSNSQGLFIDDYVQTVKEAGNVWAVPVIDLNSLSGLYPMNDSNIQYFHDSKTDRLHPNVAGHKRMAQTMMYQMLMLPSSFK